MLLPLVLCNFWDVLKIDTTGSIHFHRSHLELNQTEAMGNCGFVSVVHLFQRELGRVRLLHTQNVLKEINSQIQH